MLICTQHGNWGSVWHTALGTDVWNTFVMKNQQIIDGAVAHWVRKEKPEWTEKLNAYAYKKV